MWGLLGTLPGAFVAIKMELTAFEALKNKFKDADTDTKSKYM